MSSKQAVSYVQFREDSNPLLMSLIDVLVVSPTNEGENPGKIKVSQQFTQQFFIKALNQPEYVKLLEFVQRSHKEQYFPKLVCALETNKLRKRMVVFEMMGSTLISQLKRIHRATLQDVLIIGKQVMKRLYVLHTQYNLSYGSISLETLRFGINSTYHKIMLTEYAQIEKIQSGQKEDKVLKDVFYLFILLANVLDPDLFSGYYSKIITDYEEIKYINGALLFPKGPQQLQQCFDYVKDKQTKSLKIDHLAIIKMFKQIGQGYRFQMKKFSWQGHEQQIKDERAHLKKQEEPRPFFCKLESVDIFPEMPQYFLIFSILEKILQAGCEYGDIKTFQHLHQGLQTNQIQVEILEVHLSEFLILSQQMKVQSKIAIDDIIQARDYQILNMLHFRVLDSAKVFAQQLLKIADKKMYQCSFLDSRLRIIQVRRILQSKQINVKVKLSFATDINLDVLRMNQEIEEIKQKATLQQIPLKVKDKKMLKPALSFRQFGKQQNSPSLNISARSDLLEIEELRGESSSMESRSAIKKRSEEEQRRISDVIVPQFEEPILEGNSLEESQIEIIEMYKNAKDKQFQSKDNRTKSLQSKSQLGVLTNQINDSKHSALSESEQLLVESKFLRGRLQLKSFGANQDSEEEAASCELLNKSMVDLNLNIQEMETRIQLTNFQKATKETGDRFKRRSV